MNPKQKSVLIGAVLGALLGVAGGYLFTRGLAMPREEEPEEKLSLRSIPPGEMVKLAISVVAVLRSIAELGERI
jgi:galactitol-specific phosphotransferase system IIC component